MFWKKKDIDKYQIKFTKPDKRADYRFFPDDGEKIVIYVDDKPFQVENISAGGVAFYAKGCTQGTKYPFVLKFSDGEIKTIKGFIEIMSLTETVCRARFIDMEDEESEKIHNFVHSGQMNKIRTKKKKLRTFLK